ncbi:MAG: family transcriptional regulator, cyclic receptor protein [Chloroflexota bacterium]|nr:family transcriptional regulator, cyclic receptor protein [Chloroflexota bacterium]
MADRQEELATKLATFALFSDLNYAQLRAIVELFDEASFPDGERVLRQGISGSSFFVIVDGEAEVRVDGQPRSTLGQGEFFGEVSIFLGEAPVADVVAEGPLRCLVLAADQVEGFLNAYPHVMFRMLKAQALRLRGANQWRS